MTDKVRRAMADRIEALEADLAETRRVMEKMEKEAQE